MRVKVDNFNESPSYGVFVGLLSNKSACDRYDSDMPSVVVSVDGNGLFLVAVHPSRVSIVTEDKTK